LYFFCILGEGFSGFEKYVVGLGTILPKKMKKEDMQICFFFFILSLLYAEKIGRRRDLF